MEESVISRGKKIMSSRRARACMCVVCVCESHFLFPLSLSHCYLSSLIFLSFFFFLSFFLSFVFRNARLQKRVSNTRIFFKSFLYTCFLSFFSFFFIPYTISFSFYSLFMCSLFTSTWFHAYKDNTRDVRVALEREPFSTLYYYYYFNFIFFLSFFLSFFSSYKRGKSFDERRYNHDEDVESDLWSR